MQQTARACANEYWTDLCNLIQQAADTGNIRGMYDGIKKAIGPRVLKTAPLKSASGEARVVKFTVQQKDRKKRLVRFIAGDAKGMSVLMRGNKMYVYSPQTDNIRRVASHARRQTFMGSNMTFSDMSTIDFSQTYNAAFDKETAEHQWLNLTAKPDQDLDWAKLRLRVEKKNLSFSRIEYYDGSTLKRIQFRDKYKNDNGVPTYQRVRFVDKATGYSTTMEMLSQKIGGALSNSLFKKRNLVRGQ